MKRKILFVITAGIILAAGAFGAVKRQTYTDIASEENYMNQLQVALLPENLSDTACKKIEEKIQRIPIVLKGEAVEEVKHLFGADRQKIRITKVYKGDDLQVGKEIYIASEQWRVILEGELKSAERSFVNVMKVGKEYLVFLSGKTEDIYTDVPVYKLCEITFVAPVFCCNDEGIEKKIAAVGEESTYVPYSEVKNNEFFGETEKAHEMWAQLKEKIFAVYK